MDARAAITIRASADDLYRRWRDFESLPSFMYHLESVVVGDGGRSHWVAKAPADTRVEWDAEMTEDVPGQRIAWRSVEGSSVENAGTVELRPAPGDRGTEVLVPLTYSPPGGALGALVAKIFGEEPAQQISDDLRRFKQLVETGEVARSDGAPWGPASGGKALRQQAGQPPTEVDLREAAAEEQGVRG
jgi:uncharacterized membrane protein